MDEKGKFMLFVGVQCEHILDERTEISFLIRIYFDTSFEMNKFIGKVVTLKQFVTIISLERETNTLYIFKGEGEKSDIKTKNLPEIQALYQTSEKKPFVLNKVRDQRILESVSNN